LKWRNKREEDRQLEASGSRNGRAGMDRKTARSVVVVATANNSIGLVDFSLRSITAASGDEHPDLTPEVAAIEHIHNPSL
jgi:hypothetical protein